MNRKGMEYVGHLSLLSQHSIVDAASPYESLDVVPEEVSADKIVVTASDIDGNWDLEGVVTV